MHHSRMHKARQRPRVFVEVELIRGCPVDADDENVGWGLDRPSHPEQPGQSPVVFQRRANGTERQRDADDGDDRAEGHCLAKASHHSAAV